MNINDVRESATIFLRPCKLTFDLLSLKVVSESQVTWATCVPILVFLSLFVLELFPMYATDRQTDVREHHRLMAPPREWGHNNMRGDSSLVRRVICPKRISIGLGLGLGLASNFGICTTPFRTNDPSDK